MIWEQQTKVKMINNKYFWYFICALAIVLLFFWNGCRQRSLGKKEVLNGQLASKYKKDVQIKAVRFDSLVSVINGRDRLLKMKNDTLLQKNKKIIILENKISSSIVAISNVINGYSEKVVQFKLDSIKKIHPKEELAAYLEAPAKDSLLEAKSKRLTNDSIVILNDSISMADYNKTIIACIDLSASKEKLNNDNASLLQSKIHKRTLWVVVLSAINVAKDALFVNNIIKNTAK